MVYKYEDERAKVFTEDGQVMFLKIRDKAKDLIGLAGAVSSACLMRDISGDSWTMLACIDRLVELRELKEITGPNTWGQHRVFVKN